MDLVTFNDALQKGMSRQKKKAFTLLLANSEIFALVSDRVDKMFGWTTILPEEALLCCPCLRNVGRLVRLRAGCV